MKPRRAIPATLSIATVAVVSVAVVSVAGASPPPVDPAQLENRSDAVELEDLAWIAGHWGGEAFGGQIEEGWFGPAGRSMSGSFRLVQGGLAVMYELLLLEQDDDGEIFYRFKHINRGWQPVEETRLEYRLTELEGRKATFRSTASEPSPGAPWWFTYESPSGNELIVTMHGAGDGGPIVLSMKRL